MGLTQMIKFGGMEGDGELWVGLSVFNQPKNDFWIVKLGNFHKGPKYLGIFAKTKFYIS